MNFVSHNANLNVKKGHIMDPRELRWCHRCWLIYSKPLSLFNEGLHNFISIASRMRRLNVLLSVTRTFVLLESTK